MIDDEDENIVWTELDPQKAKTIKEKLKLFKPIFDGEYIDLNDMIDNDPETLKNFIDCPINNFGIDDFFNWMMDNHIQWWKIKQRSKNIGHFTITKDEKLYNFYFDPEKISNQTLTNLLKLDEKLDIEIMAKILGGNEE